MKQRDISTESNENVTKETMEISETGYGYVIENKQDTKEYDDNNRGQNK
ncbi:hypothetical protein [Bacillus sp. FJAT-45350]|nr:hypothetical protein [Bacillus sp. FJAT-45350]